MTNLSTLARKISKCSLSGGKRRRYPNELKSKICLAAKQYGLAYASKALGVDGALIFRWSKKYSIEKLKPKTLTFHEISPIVGPPGFPLQKEASMIRFISPTGASMELNLTSEVCLPELVAIFINGNTR